MPIDSLLVSVVLALALASTASGCGDGEDGGEADPDAAASGDAATSGDAAPADASPTDASPTDATPTDATPTDASPTDASPADASPADASPPGPCDGLPEGAVLSAGEFGPCGFAADCDETGEQRREQQVCRAGVSTPETASQACGRNSDDLECLVGGRCLDGQCTCPAGQPELCAGQCVRLDDDVQNCGACAVACGADEACVAGRCSPPCGDGVLGADEECDDGNHDDDDGCAQCRLTSPLSCSGLCDSEGTVAQVAPISLGLVVGSAPRYAMQLGRSAAVSGDWALFGTGGAQANNAYVFRRGPDGRWLEHQQLSSDDFQQGDRYGAAVAMDGDWAVVGSPYDTGVERASGSAYVYHRNAQGQWLQVQKLVPAQAAADDHFGASVALRGGRLVVGAPETDERGTDSGAVHIYELTPQRQWDSVARLVGAGALVNERLGTAVGVEGELVVAGAPGGEPQPTSLGATYVFERSADGVWATSARLALDDGPDLLRFGSAVAVEDQQVWVGAPGAESLGAHTGAAYVFGRGPDARWRLEGEFTAPDAQPGSHFGSAVAVRSGHALIGAVADLRTGAVYVLDRDDRRRWTHVAKLRAEDAGLGDEFGFSVATDGLTAVVGAKGYDQVELHDGAAYLYALHSPTCTQDGLCLCVDGGAGPLCDDRPFCGDGNLNAAEQCEDGNIAYGDGCDAMCRLEP